MVCVEVSNDHVWAGPGVVECVELFQQRCHRLARARLIINVAEIKEGGLPRGVQKRDTDSD
jgi:hypothetical protein